MAWYSKFAPPVRAAARSRRHWSWSPPWPGCRQPGAGGCNAGDHNELRARAVTSCGAMPGRRRDRGLRGQRHRHRHQAAKHGAGDERFKADPGAVARLGRRGRRRGPDRLLRPAGAGLSGDARRRRMPDRLRPSHRRWSPVPLQLQLLEPEHLPIHLNTDCRPATSALRHRVRQRLGRRVAYHLYRSHPGGRTVCVPMSGPGRDGHGAHRCQ